MPADFANVGDSEHTQCQGLLGPTSATQIEHLRVFTLQGHPEYIEDWVMRESIEVKVGKGQVSKQTALGAREACSTPSDGIALASLMLAMMQSASARQGLRQ